jgi:hypothetical protein
MLIAGIQARSDWTPRTRIAYERKCYTWNADKERYS